MIEVPLTNTMLQSILAIEQNRSLFPEKSIPTTLSSHLRKLSRKRSSHASTRIEGNPLSEEQASKAIDDAKRHFLKPEEEVRNYYAALELLDDYAKGKRPIDLGLLLEVQHEVVAGESAEKIGLRGPMPPGVLFAVYDASTGAVEYIPPESADVEGLLEELFDYLEVSDDHPLIKAAVLHYQLATIHPFEDGNGRTARLMSGYFLDLSDFGFDGIGSLEEYFAYDIDEYYASLQMDLPALYYEGRNDPPHPEIWVEYFLRMMALYAQRTRELAHEASNEQEVIALSHLNPRERNFYTYLVEQDIDEFTPIEMSRLLGVSNRTIINWSAALSKVGLLEPQLVKQRVRSYKRL